MKQDTIHVVVALDFSDEIIEMLQGISPRLKVERHFPKVSDHVWKQAEVLFTSRLVPTPDQAPNLKWIQITSAGMEHLTSEPIIAATDVMVTSASGIHAVPIAELTLGMMLAW